MQTYIIDGNNLIGKIKKLFAVQKTNPQNSRERLVHILDRYFAQKKQKVSLHFDGFPGLGIKLNRGKIYYSYGKTADYEIKQEIERANNPRLITIVSSDHEIQNFAKVCGCKIINSESFRNLLFQSEDSNSEEEIAKSISTDEIKKLFGVE